MAAGVVDVIFTEDVAIVSLTTSVGDDGRSTVSETTTTVKAAHRHRVTADEGDFGVVAQEEVAVYFPASVAPPATGDYVEIRGERYEVVGTAYPQVRYRDASIHHHEVRVRRSER